MKRIVIVTRLNNRGGIELSLINLLNSLPKNKVEIDLAIINKSDKLICEIPDWVNVVIIHSCTSYQILKKRFNFKFIREFLYDLIKIVRKKLYVIFERKKSFHSYHLSMFKYENFNIIYDVAIAWCSPNSEETVYTIEKIKSKKKYLWIHMDVSKDLQPFDAIEYFTKFDKIFCVSKSCKKSFDKCYPLLSNKTHVFYNVMPKNKIEDLSKNNVEISEKFKIVTLGRLSAEKNPFLGLQIIKKLLENNTNNFVWYFIGNGNLYEDMNNYIKMNKLNDYVILIGEKKNPYPYLSKADLYVQMSEHESFCLSLAEAQVVGVPAVTTNFASAYEIVHDRFTGYITETNLSSLYEKISFLINNQNELNKMKKNLKNVEFTALSDGNDFIKLLND